MAYNNINDINPYVIQCFHTGERNCPQRGTDYGERKVKWFELELILWGEGYIITEGKRIPAQKGDIFFRRPGMTVQGFAPYHCYLIVFDMFSDTGMCDYIDPEPLRAVPHSNDMTGIGNAIRDVEGLDFPYVMNATGFIEFEKLFSGIYNEYIFHRKESQFYLKAYIMQILMMMHIELSRTSWLQHPNRSIRLNYTKVMAVKNHIDNSVQSRFRLNDLARIADLSPNFLCKVFKDIIGETPVNYINKNKINLAKKLLIETSKDLRQIAFECGFENDTYFFKLFKKLEGLSPSVFRERQQMTFSHHGK